MGGGPHHSPPLLHDDSDDTVTAHSSESDVDTVRVDLVGRNINDSSSSSTATPHTLLVYAKSKVYTHPSSYSRDNLPGWLTIVKRGRGDFLLSWIPESLVGDQDRDNYIKLEVGDDGQVVEVASEPSPFPYST